MASTTLAGLKKIFFDSIFERSYWTWRKHPLIVVSSMLGTAISVIDQSIVTLGVMLLLISLSTSGLLTGYLSQLNQHWADFNLLQNSSYASLIIPIVSLSIIVVVLTAIIGPGS